VEPHARLDNISPHRHLSQLVEPLTGTIGQQLVIRPMQSIPYSESSKLIIPIIFGSRNVLVGLLNGPENSFVPLESVDVGLPGER
jgi:hypothetical protein